MINMEEKFSDDNNFLNIDYTFNEPIFFDGNKYNNLKDAIASAKIKHGDDWLDNKNDVLKDINYQKYDNNKDLKEKLMNIGDISLEIQDDNDFTKILTKITL